MLASCRVEFAPQTETEEAGLAVYSCPTNHYEIAVTLRGGQRCVMVKKRVGDLTQEIRIESNDEIGELLHALRAMNAKLTTIVRQVRGGTDTIATASAPLVASRGTRPRDSISAVTSIRFTGLSSATSTCTQP